MTNGVSKGKRRARVQSLLPSGKSSPSRKQLRITSIVRSKR